MSAEASSDPTKVRAEMPGMAVYADPLSLATAEGVDLVLIATSNASRAHLARAWLHDKIKIDTAETGRLPPAR